MASKEEWQFVYDQEEGELFCLSLIEEIIQESEEILFRKHIDVQILPYAVDFARQSIMKIVRCFFYTRDNGNSDPILWEVDEDPEPVRTDSWARGCVQARDLVPNLLRVDKAPDSPESLKHELPAPITKPKKRTDNRRPNVPILREPTGPKSNFSRSKYSLAPTDTRKVKFKNTNNSQLPKESMKLKSAISVPIINSKKSNLENYAFDADGNKIPILSTGLTCLPPPIKAKVAPIDIQKQSKIDLTVKSKAEPKKIRHSVTNTSNNKPEQPRNSTPPLIPSILDTIKLSNGVTVREGERVKTNEPKVRHFNENSIEYEEIEFESLDIKELEKIIHQPKPIIQVGNKRISELYKLLREKY